MCGFCGLAYSDPDRPCATDRLIAMRERIAHRGPDGVGALTIGPVGLGHRRLSIIDVAGGQQPLANEDETIWVTYNGEIYNYLELRRTLTAAGHRFATKSDTEVLVHAYEEWGDEFVSRLNGMFAFGLLDARRKRVLLARDQLGIKPVFYEVTPEGLFFGSEIKAVLAGSGSSPRLSAAALPEYLLFRYAAWDRSLLEGVRRLPPGHLAIWEDGQLRTRAYWTPANIAPTVSGRLEDAVEELDSLLSAAVRDQLMSEVPLGVFCSGGVDSGLVTRFAGLATDQPLHSFSVGFSDSRWDETRLARESAGRAGAMHHVVVCNEDQLGALVPDLLWHHDEPLSHPNSVPLAVLSRFARERVTVVLTGEGPDEYLSGYPRHHIYRFQSRLSGAIPGWAVRRLGRALGWVPARRTRLAGELMERPFDESLVLNSRYVAPAVVTGLLGGGVGVGEAIEIRRDLARRMAVEGDGVASLNRYELVTYVQCALDRMDRMSMAYGLEARVPFLDLRLVEWGLRLPSRFKATGRGNKVVLKALADRYLSREVARGRKSGFGLPLDRWFRSSALEPLLRPLHDSEHPANAHFERSRLRRLLDEHQVGSADHGELLWLITNVFQWYEVQASNRGVTSVAA